MGVPCSEAFDGVDESVPRGASVDIGMPAPQVQQLWHRAGSPRPASQRTVFMNRGFRR
jgi:hypothetical protein